MWMLEAPSPIHPFLEDSISTAEIVLVIRKSKGSSTPSPVDQIHYKIFKHCLSLVSALHHLYNKCWSTLIVPSQWKAAVLKLLGKKAATSEPSNPSNF
jgi:hypothetical protein